MGYLYDMIGRRRATVKEYVAGFSGEKLKRQLDKSSEPKPVLQLLSERRDVAVIAGFRKGSPARGAIAAYADAEELAGTFEKAGAALLACYTEPEDDLGSIDDIAEMRAASDLPIIACDHVVTSEQMALYRALGADACTILAGQVGDKLGSFLKLCLHVGLMPIVEVHAAPELDAALALGAPLLLIDATDPDTHVRDFDETIGLVRDARAFDAIVIVGGVQDRAEAQAAGAAGAHAVLVAEPVMEAFNPAEALSAFVGVARRRDTHRTSIEVCGVTSSEQAAEAVEAGADALACVFIEGHPAQIAPEAAARIFNELPAGVRRIGVFEGIDIDAIHRTVATAGIDSIQLYGAAKPVEIAQLGRPVIRALRLGIDEGLPLEDVAVLDEPVVSVMMEAPAGFDWSRLLGRPASLSLIASGAFAPAEAAEVVAACEPAAMSLWLDDSSDIAAFVAAVREGDLQINERSQANL